MHGIIFAEMKRYCETRFGSGLWDNILKESGIGWKIYLQKEEYPDEEATAIVSTVSKVTGKPVSGILEDFGEFIVPTLFSIFGALIRAEWKTLDLLEHTEKVIHTAVRVKDPIAKPPQLECYRKSPEEIVIFYNSPRKMCALAKGIIKGVASYYNEKVFVSEPKCMLIGSPKCEIEVRLLK